MNKIASNKYAAMYPKKKIKTNFNLPKISKAKKIEVVEHKSEFASIPVASVKYLNDPVSDSKFKHDSSLSTFKVLRTKQSF